MPFARGGGFGAGENASGGWGNKGNSKQYGSVQVDWIGASQLWQFRRGNPDRGESGSKPERIPVPGSDKQFQSVTSRSLVNQGHSVFVKMKEIRESAVDPTNLDPKECLEISHEYRTVLETCANALYESFAQRAERGEGLPSEAEEIEFMELRQMSQVWSLAEIFFIRERHLKKHGGYVVQSLCNWVRQCFPGAQNEAQHFLGTGEPLPPRDDPQLYWQVLYQLLLQGETETVHELLGLHDGAGQPQSAVTVVQRLLHNMPTLGVGDGFTEFQRQWNKWQKECQEALRRDRSDYTISQVPELVPIVRLLAGDVHVFDDLKEYADVWCQLLVARLLYTSPLAMYYDLQIDIDWARTTMNMMNTSENKVEELYYHVMNIDQLALIKGACECWGSSWWLSVHLIDILVGLRTKFGGHAETLRNYLLREFTEHLMAEPSLFSIVPTYCSARGVQGLDHLECFLSKVPLQSDRKALKVLRLAELHGLTHVKQEICRVMGRRATDVGQTGSALAWYTRAGDEASIDAITQLANTLLANYQRTRLSGRQPHLQRVKPFLPVETKSDRMEFLREYANFLDARQSEQYEDAAAKLVDILNRNAAPRWFQFDVLLDAMPLLAIPNKVIFSETDTLILMRTLEGITTSVHGTRCLDMSDPKRIRQLDELRLALTRNLASAIMCPPSR